MKTLALAFVLVAAPALAVQAPVQPNTPVIVTMGEGVVKRAPDRAFVILAAESRAKTAPEAQRVNTDAMTAVLDKIKSLGIAADAIQTTGLSLQPEFDYQNGRQTLRGYVARNQVDVRVDALARLGDVLASAVGSGVTNVNSVRFDVKDRDGAESEALRAAVRDARRRADAAASGAGVRVLQVVRIDEERQPPQYPVQPMARMAGVAAAPAPVPVEAGEIEIRARVTMTVSIQ
jgi:uncharacterized protein YggE